MDKQFNNINMIRQEEVQDYKKVFKVIEAAFKNVVYSVFSRAIASI